MANLYSLLKTINFSSSGHIPFELDWNGILKVGCLPGDNYVIYGPREYSCQFMMKVRQRTGFWGEITFLLGYNLFFCKGKFNTDSYLQIPIAFDFAIDEKISECESAWRPHINITGPTVTYIFEDAIFVDMSSEDKKTQFFFKQNDNFGIFVDKNFAMTGFVVYLFTKEEKESLKEFLDYRKKNYKDIEIEYIGPKSEWILPMNDKRFLINKIFELKNVSLEELIYFGFVKEIIKDSFVVEFAMEYILRQDNVDPLWVNIAEFQPDKVPWKKITDMFEKKIKDSQSILTSKMPLFNKIWFYLFTAATMKEMNLIDQ